MRIESLHIGMKVRVSDDSDMGLSEVCGIILNRSTGAEDITLIAEDGGLVDGFIAGELWEIDD